MRNKLSDKQRKASRLDIIVMLYFVLRDTKKFDWVDMEHTMAEVVEHLKEEVSLPESILTSALFCLNEADRRRYFKSPKDEYFDQFVKTFLAPNEYYDAERGTIERRVQK